VNSAALSSTPAAAAFACRFASSRTRPTTDGDHDTTGATAANMVATAAVEFFRAYGVQL